MLTLKGSTLPSWALVVSVVLLETLASDGTGPGRLPTLGWNSWNAYQCAITEDKFLQAANALVSTGLQAAGYQYVNIDDCWSEKSGRDANNHMVPDATKFPSGGIAGLAEKIHALGLKLGIYSTAGTLTCAGYPASLGFEDIDAKDFSDWGVDYLKYDNCNVPSNWTDQYAACDPEMAATTSNGTCNPDLGGNLAPEGYDWSTSNSAIRFNRMRDALAKQEHEISLSLCIWGAADVFSWGNKTGISWRMSGDVTPHWEDIMRILNEQSFRLYSTGFYGHNDMDMLEIGNGMTDAEARTHFAFWAANKSPLLIGTDLAQISQENLDILKNKYLLAFNQDPVFGGPARPYKWGTNPDNTFNESFPAEYWAGESSAGHLVLVLNNDNNANNKTIDWSEIPGLDDEAYEVTDVWTGEDLGCVNSYTTTLAAHDTAALLVGDACC